MVAEVVSRCCDAPVENGTGVALSGLVSVQVCKKCRLSCRTHLLWNELPPVGTFEKPLRARTTLEDTYGS